MAKKDTLGDRMKHFENCFDYKFIRSLPMIVRLDGRAFHSWTRKTRCTKPFDHHMMQLMAETTKFLCENCDGCVLGYTQSDEISLLFLDNNSRDTTVWFDRRVQKLVSLTASMASCYFNTHNPYPVKYPAFFDSRAFVIPPEDIRGYFIWRQNDATKNSLSMLAQSLYSQKELTGKKRDDLQELCWAKGHNWNDLSTAEKRGTAVYKVPVKRDTVYGEVTRMKFVIDENIPIFSADDCTLFTDISIQEK
jgi:tRNA(His) 5'-end guanylyltransferase